MKKYFLIGLASLGCSYHAHADKSRATAEQFGSKQSEVSTRSTHWQKLGHKDVKIILARKDIQSQLKSAESFCFFVIKPDFSRAIQYLKNAPDEGAAEPSVYFDIPLPDGTFLNLPYFRVHVSSPELEKRFPDILSFAGASEQGSHATDISPGELSIQLLRHRMEGIEKRIYVDNFHPIINGIRQAPLTLRGEVVYMSRAVRIRGESVNPLKQCD